NMYEDMPQRKVGEIFENLLYSGHSLGFDIAGTKETVTDFTRQTFLDYINSLYHPNNAVLVVAGGMSKPVKEYVKIIEEKFGNWKLGEKITFDKIIESQTEPQKLIKYKKTEQAHFVLGYRSFSFDDERKYALNLLATILGGGMSSRLFIQVRERRGLCYYISSGGEFYHDCGSFMTQAGVTNNLEKVREAVKTVLEEHEKIKTGVIGEKELLKAKEMIKGRLMLSMEDSMNIASFFGTKKILQNKILTPQEIIQKIEAVTANEIAMLAKEIFIPKNLNFALIGPFYSNDYNDLLK
ncbi:MAG: pitrilysin family protein, partial [Patescibacteria group bacterium]